ncbi:hypothetical protein, partial [Nitratifractor sp.]
MPKRLRHRHLPPQRRARRTIQPKLCSRKCARCVDARCEGVHSQNVGAPGGCVEALDVSPMPP